MNGFEYQQLLEKTQRPLGGGSSCPGRVYGIWEDLEKDGKPLSSASVTYGHNGGNIACYSDAISNQNRFNLAARVPGNRGV